VSTEKDLQQIAKWQRELDEYKKSPEYKKAKEREKIWEAEREGSRGVGYLPPIWDLDRKGPEDAPGERKHREAIDLADSMQKKIEMARETPGFADATEAELDKPDTTIREKVARTMAAKAEDTIPKPSDTTPTPKPKPKTKPPETEQETQEYYDNLKREAREELSGSERTTFLNRLEQLRKQAADDTERLGWAAVAEKLGQALLRMGAAYQGMKEGLDLSTGLKFDKTDWEKKLDRVQRRYEVDLDRLEKEEARFERGEERKEAKAEREEREQVRKEEREEDIQRQKDRDEENYTRQKALAELRQRLTEKTAKAKAGGKVPKDQIAYQDKLNQRYKEQQDKITKILDGLTEDLDTKEEWEQVAGQLRTLGFTEEQVGKIGNAAQEGEGRATFSVGDYDADVIRKYLTGYSDELRTKQEDTFTTREKLLASGDDLPVGTTKEFQGKNYRYTGGGQFNRANWEEVE
jgi:hypothetical protein